MEGLFEGQDLIAVIAAHEVRLVAQRVLVPGLQRKDQARITRAISVMGMRPFHAAHLRRIELDYKGRRRAVLEYDWPGQRIWGATAAILSNLRQRLEEKA